MITLCLLLAFCPDASASSKKRFDFLLWFYDLNAEAIAWQRHCNTDQVKPSKAFKEADEYVTQTLLEEAAADNPRVAPEYIQKEILKRRADLQYRLDMERMKAGCDTPDIQRAKAHYLEISSHSLADIKKLVADRTGEP